ISSKSHLIKDCDVYNTVDTFPSVILKAASVPAGSRNSSASTSAGRSIPAASRNKPASIHACRHIPAGRFNKLAPFPSGRFVPTGWTNHAARPFFRPTNLCFDNVSWPGIYEHMSMNEGRCGSAVKSSAGNKEKLDDFVQIKGGTVTFGGRDSKITGKGTIRTFKLNFENVYYVEELQNFKLYSVSQICDKKNKVLFTDGECLVLTKEFQLPDESQTINKLAKNGLVEGLPLKIFTNEHNCVACNKGKQHKASYKAISAVRTLSEPLQLLHMDLFGPTSIRKVVTACYVLNRVSIANPHNKTPYELLSGKVPNIRHLKPFGCQVTILNTSDHLGKFKGIANEGFLVGYASNSIQDDDSESECDEHAIFVPSFPSNSFSGPKVTDVSAPMENNLDYAEELARLQKQEHEAHSAAAKYGFEFSNKTTEMLHQAKIETRRNLVLAAGDPAGSIVSTGGVHAGSVRAGSIPASHVPASSVPSRSVPASNVPDGGVLVGRIDYAGFGDPAASESVPAVFTLDYAANSTLPPGHSLGSSEHSTRFPSPSDLRNHQHMAGIFSSSSYDDDFCADVSNLPSSVAVDHVATKRVNTIYPQSQIIRELQSPVQTRSTVQKSKFGESAFISYIAIETKWILKNKRDARGIVVRNKARLVAQGHRQEEGIDYDEVFAPVSRIEAIKLFLAFASYMGFMVYQMDVKSAFLYREIEEEVYVTQPKGFKDPHKIKHVYRVVKALYGLHQALRACQDKYVKDMLKKFDMESVRNATTPYEVPKHKSKDEPNDAINVYLYRSMIGSFMYLTASRPDIMFAVSACSRHQVTPMTSYLNAVKKIFKKSITGGCQFLGRRLISCQCKKQTVVATSSTEAEYVAAASCCGQITICIVKNPVFHQRTKHIEIRHHFIRDANEKNLIQSTLGCSIPSYWDWGRNKPKGRLTIVYFMYTNFFAGRPPMLLVVPVFLLVVLVHADGWVSAGSYTIPTGSCTISTGPSEIIATIDGNEVVVTESLIRTQLQLNDANGLYEFTLHDVLDEMQEIRTYNFSKFILDAMIGIIGSKRHKFLMYPRFLQMILGIQTTDPSPRPIFDFTAKLFSNMKLNWDGPHMPLLAPMLVVPAGGDGANAAAAGAAAANAVSLPPPPPDVPPTHTSSSTPRPSAAAQDTPVREPTPSPVREPTNFWEPTPDSPRPPSPPPYPRSEEVSPTTSTRPPSPTRQTSFQEDISEGGGAEDSAALTDLSLKLDRCINRVTTLENKLGVTKKVLGGAILKLVSRVKRLEGLLQQRKRILVLFDSEGEEDATKEQDIDLDALHKLASTSLGGDTTVEAAYTIYKASQDAHASSDAGDAGHDADEVPDDTTMPFRCTRTKQRRLRKTYTSSAFKHFQENISAVEDTIPAGDGILADAQTIHVGCTPIPTSGGVSAGGPMDLAGQAAAATSSTILAADKGKAPMEAVFARQQEELAQKAQAKGVALPAEQGDDVNEDNMNERLGMLFMRKRRELAEQSRVKPMNKTQQRDFLRDFVKNQSASVYNQGWTMKQVPASVPAASSTAADVSVPVAPSIAANVDADESRLDDTQTASEHVSTEHTVDESTPSSSCSRRKHIAKKRVTPIVDVADDALIKFDSTNDSDDDPLPYSPYADWEMVPTPLGFIHAYYDMEEHTKHFTSLRELLHMVEKNDLRNCWVLCRLYPRAQVHVLETVDRRVNYMFVDVSYPLSVATLKRMLKHGLEVPKLLVGGDLTMAEQLVTQNWMVITFHVPFWNDKWLVQGGTALELAIPEQTATGKDVSNPFMAVMVCQKPLGYFSSPMIHVPRAGLVINPPG
nr:hypothetical protein [Tanacetum cinerariifolium]